MIRVPGMLLLLFLIASVQGVSKAGLAMPCLLTSLKSVQVYTENTFLIEIAVEK